MSRDQVENQLWRASAECQHSLAKLMSMAGNDLVRRFIELCHYLAIGSTGRARAGRKPIQHTYPGARFREMKRRGATGNTAADDHNIMAFAGSEWG